MRKSDPLHPSQNTTGFFRDGNVSTFATTVMPLVFGQQDRTIELTEVGCSNGKETWTLASTFASLGLDVAINAIDADPNPLLHARFFPRYRGRMHEMLGRAASYGFPEGIAKYFEVAGWRRHEIKPAAELVGRVVFNFQNIQRQPLPPASCDALIAYFVLMHYDEPERDELFANMVNAVRQGGVLSVGSTKSTKDWVESLPDRFPVRPIPEAGEWAESTFIVVGQVALG